jgi:hypothetical protein
MTALGIDERGREQRLRRAAKRQGVALVKAKTRSPDHPSYGTYGLIDPARNAWVAADWNNGYGLTLDEVEAWLSDEERGAE